MPSLKRILKIIISTLIVYSGFAELFYRLFLRRSSNMFRILVYHRIRTINSSANPIVRSMNVAPKQFDKQLAFLMRKFNVISLDELFQRITTKESLPRATLAITFDDGYLDNYQQAFPLLKRHHLPATIFIATDFIDDRRQLWWDEIEKLVTADSPVRVWRWLSELTGAKYHGNFGRKYLKLIRILSRVDNSARNGILVKLATKGSEDKCQDNKRHHLNWKEINDMARENITFGAHTKTHVTLSQCSSDIARAELSESKNRIETKLNRKVSFFAYPSGAAEDVNETSIRLVKEAGFKMAFMNIPGVNTTGDDLFQLKRIGIYGTDNFAAFVCRCYGIF